jgi:polyphenol oxidase
MDWRQFPSYFSFSRFPVLTFCTTRCLAGSSLYPYASSNFSFTVGDNPEAVRGNRLRMASMLDVPPRRFRLLRQVHGDTVIDIGRHPGWDLADQQVPEADAMVSASSGFTLAVMLADCVGVALYDPEKGVAGVAHSGWKGTAVDICGKLVDIMARNWGCRVGEIVAGIGPSICGKCYAVSEGIARQFRGKYGFAISGNPGAPFLDLPAIVRYQLLSRGLRAQHIEYPGICTCSNTHLWYSHRAEKRTGRFILGIRT